MIRLTLVAALVAIPAAAVAQDQQATTGQPPKRIRELNIARNEPCPPSTADEVVVCHTLDEPYRIPKQFRNEAPIPAQNQSWVNRAATVDQVGREAAGLPDTCSPIGTGGQTGCRQQQMQAYAADRRARKQAAGDATTPP